MGVEYLTPDEIAHKHEHIKDRLDEQPNYFVRSGGVQKILPKYSKKESIILEVGIGQGALARTLISDGYSNIVGVDIDNYLPSDLKEEVDFQRKDICFQSLDVENESVDIVLAIAIIEHLENPLFPIREFSRVLKRGGIFIFAIPHIFSLRSRFLFLLNGDITGFSLRNNHITLHTKSLYKKLFLKNFEELEVKYSKGYIRLFGRKVYLPDAPFLNKWFGNKAMYVLRKK